MLTALILHVEPLAWEQTLKKCIFLKTLPNGCLKTKRQCSQAGCCHVTHVHLQRNRRSYLLHLWWKTVVSSYEQRPFIFSELGHRKWTLVWRTVIIQTCSKCAFPHERQVENGIKLVQGRFILVKESRIRDWSIGSNTFPHLIAQCWGPSAKFPLFFDPLFILPQWNRFPRIH